MTYGSGLLAILLGFISCAESVGRAPATSIHETIQTMKGACTSAMTEEESDPFEKQLRSHGLAAVDPLIGLARSSEPTGCRVMAVFVLAYLAREHVSLIPRLVRELVPLAEDKDLQQLVTQIFSGFGDAANEELIAHLTVPPIDQRRAAFVALVWINKSQIADRADLRDFDLNAPDKEWHELAHRWEVWWSTTKGERASKP